MTGFYFKLTISNIKKNKSIYFPFFLTNLLSVVIFFIMASIQSQEIIENLPGSYVFIQFLEAGVIMTGIFSGVFLLYTNKFLIKQRKKELGLYNIFGLEKKHIAKLLCYEIILISSVGIGIGILLGACLGKIFFLILLKLLRLNSNLTFHFSIQAMIQTIFCFVIIGIIIVIYNIFSVAKSKPVELLYAANKGDNYRSFTKIKAILGGGSLVIAYTLMLTIQSPIEIIGRIIPISILILFGTILFFSSCSVVILKRLKQNEKYYYNPKNFVSVSSLIYRLKQNARGLSNICILSTVVMVITTTTLSLYVGQKEMLAFSFPMETKISIDASKNDINTLNQFIYQIVDQYDITINKETSFNTLRLSGVYKDGKCSIYQPGIDNPSDTCGIYLMTLEDYNRMEGKKILLENSEILAFSSSHDLGKEYIKFGTLKYNVKDELDSLSIQNKSILSSETHCYFICSTQDEIDKILAELNPSENKFRWDYNVMFDSSGEKEKLFISTLQNQLNDKYADINFENVLLQGETDSYTYGGFLFVGLLLSLLFIIFLTLIIYYKQITEGYNDRYNFEVMQKIGLDQKEAKDIIYKEISTMFFLPLFGSVLHLIVSIYAIAMLLATFGLSNIIVLLICASIIVILFVIIYIVTYFSTAKIYYKIVMK